MFIYTASAVGFAELLVETLDAGIEVRFRPVEGSKKVAVSVLSPDVDGVSLSVAGKVMDSFRDALSQFKDRGERK